MAAEPPELSPTPPETIEWWMRSGPSYVILNAVFGFLLGATILFVASIVGLSMGTKGNSAGPWLWNLAGWLALLGGIAAWLCFIYVRRSFRTRVWLLFGIGGGTLVAASILMAMSVA